MRPPQLLLASIVAFVCLSLGIEQALAQWAANGAPVCTASSAQGNVRVVSDGAHGMIAAWEDARGGTANIYAQRLDAAGNHLWPLNGVLLSGTGTRVRMVSDGAGGAIAVWRDSRSGAIGVYGQRLNAMGVAQWTAGGVRLSTTSGEPMIDADGSGGGVIAWSVGSLPTRDIYAQHVNASGAPQWGAAGATVCRHPADQYDVSVVTDGVGGAILAWVDKRAATNRVFARRVGTAGDTLWGPNGNAVSPNSPATFAPALVSDGAGGAFITVPDQRQSGQGTHLYVYRFTSAGSAQAGWVAGGVDLGLCLDPDPKPVVIQDRSAGVIVAQSGGLVDHVTAAGALDWFADVVSIVNSAFDAPVRLSLVSDGSGGACVAWDDYRNMNDYNVYATRVISGGTVADACTGSGEALCESIGYQQGTSICTDGNGGALVAWNDARTDAGDVYAAPVTCGSPTAVGPETPAGLSLLGAWPNPATRGLRVAFVLQDSGPAELSLHDPAGRVVLRQELGGLGAGVHSVTLDHAGRLAPGTYFLRLAGNGRVVSTKVSLLR